MAPKPGRDEVVYRKSKRSFLQWGGPGAGNAVAYSGADAQYVDVGDADNPVRGGITPRRVHDPYAYGRFRRIGATIDAPDDPTNSISFSNILGALSRIRYNPRCYLNLYEPSGQCTDPTDISGGWQTKVSIYSYGLVTTRSEAGNTSQLSGEDDVEVTEANVTWEGGKYDIGQLFFGEAAAAEVTTHIKDIVYGTQIQCGDCGPENDGTKWLYAIADTDGASPPAVGKVVYSTDGGNTWTALPITGLTAGQSLDAIDIVGQYLVVLSQGMNRYFFTAINTLTGIPSSSWTAVSTGFVAAKLPTDMYVLNSREIWFCGLGGYIYKSTDITAGVSVINAGVATTNNLRRISGERETVVAVGDTGTIVLSGNRGRSWAVAVNNASITDRIQAVAVLGPYKFWIGTNAGRVYWTDNQANSWTELNFDGSGTGQVTDIAFATDDCGYFAHADATPTARLFATFTGGRIWDLSTNVGQKRVANWPTFDRINRIAVPGYSDLGVLAGNVAVGGVADNATDGVIHLGLSSVLA